MSKDWSLVVKSRQMYLRFVSEPDDPSIVPLLSVGASIDGCQTRVFLLEGLLTLDHFDLDTRTLKSLSDVLLDPKKQSKCFKH